MLDLNIETKKIQNFNKNLIHKNKNIKDSYEAISFIFLNNKDINLFFFSVFVENFNLFLLENYSFYNLYTKNNFDNDFFKQSFNFTVSNRFFFDFNYFSSNVISDIDNFDIKINIDFYNKSSYDLNFKSLIKNSTLFWING